MNKKPTTKDKLCYSSIKLFSENGYDNCGIREIAKSVGIKSSSIYKHFSSKEDILIYILDLFDQNFIKDSIQPSELLEKAKTKPLSETYMQCFYLQSPLEERKRMLDILRIIFSLRYQNETVKTVYNNVFFKVYQDYLTEVTDGLRKLGMIKDIDYSFINYMMISTAVIKLEFILANEYKYEEKYSIYSDTISELVQFFTNTYSTS